MVSALLLSLVQTPTVTIEPAVYTYAELASKMNVPGYRVGVQTGIDERLCVVSLKERTWEQASTLLSGGLGISFRKTPDGGYLLSEDEGVAARESQQLAAFCAYFDRYADKVAREVERAAGGKLPASPKRIAELEANELKAQASSDAIQANQPDSKAKSAIMAYMLSTGKSDMDVKPFVHQFFSTGSSIRKLIPMNWVEGMQPFNMTSSKQGTPWENVEAVNIFRARLDQEQVPLDKRNEIAKRGWVARTIGFNPVALNVVWAEYILTEPDENSGSATKGTPSFYLPPALTQQELARILKAGDPADNLDERVAQSTKLLGGELGSKHTVATGVSSAALLLKAWTQEHKQEVIAPVSLIRDPRGRAKDAVTLRHILAVPNLFPITSASLSDNVLIVKNELSFLDNRYRLPGKAIAELLKKTDPAKGYAWADLVQYAKTTSAAQNGILASIGIEIVPRWLPGSVPALLIMDSLGETRQKAVWQELRRGQRVTLNMSEFPAGGLTRGGQAEEELVLQGKAFERAFGNPSKAGAHPRWSQELRGGTALIYARPDNDFQGAHTLNISFTKPEEIGENKPTSLKPRVPTFGSARLDGVILPAG